MLRGGVGAPATLGFLARGRAREDQPAEATPAHAADRQSRELERTGYRDYVADYLEVDGGYERAVEACLADGVVAGVPFSRLDPKAGLDDVLLLAATETTTSDDISALTRALQRNLGR